MILIIVCRLQNGYERNYNSRFSYLLLINITTKCRKPVSYTHLDVYKRQALLSAESITTLDMSHGTCLLYTSRCV